MEAYGINFGGDLTPAVTILVLIVGTIVIWIVWELVSGAEDLVAAVKKVYSDITGFFTSQTSIDEYYGINGVPSTASGLYQPIGGETAPMDVIGGYNTQ